ncbi:MAG: class I SAM-dependent methyltransferase [Caldilineaceae bacterium]|nr:class I SAM-dependent methyltransferase [Caldilineaceae bacterium]
MHEVVTEINSTSAPAVDWGDWLNRWEAQQSGLIVEREARFSAMLDVLEVLLPADFVALDLCSGPGSISHRVLKRFPQARTVAVDLDPFLLAIGKGALGDFGGRLSWQEADLRQPAWIEALGATHFDAVLTTTALHWLPSPDLARVYHQLGNLIRPGGILLNGDNLKFGPHQASFRKVAETLRSRKPASSSDSPRAEEWAEWWEAARQDASVQALVAQRDERFSWRSPDNWVNPIYDFHAAALREAGFVEVDTIWQCFGNRVLMAVR